MFTSSLNMLRLKYAEKRSDRQSSCWDSNMILMLLPELLGDFSVKALRKPKHLDE